eukprot:9083347-Pyramimonas_sp.AAC.1
MCPLGLPDWSLTPCCGYIPQTLLVEHLDAFHVVITGCMLICRLKNGVFEGDEITWRLFRNEGLHGLQEGRHYEVNSRV